MVSADALTIFSGIIILFCNSGKSADFPELPFHGRNPLSHLALLDASSPEGEAFWHLSVSADEAPPSGELARRKA